MRRATTAIISAALLLAACSSGGDAEEPDDSSSEESATTDAADPADVAVAESALLTLSDFPSGWSEVPDVEEESSIEMEAARLEFAACFGSDTESILDFAGAEAETGDFTSPDDSTVSNNVAVADEAAAEDFMGRFAGDGVTECLNEAAAKVIEIGFSQADDVPADVEIGTVSVGRLNLTPAGDDLVAYRITIPFSGGGFEAEIYIDQIAVRVGRAISGLNVQSTVVPIDASEIDGYVSLAAERLAAAL